MPITRAADISGVVHAYRGTRDLFPLCADTRFGHAPRYLAQVQAANSPPQGRSVTCLWCTIALMRSHA